MSRLVCCKSTTTKTDYFYKLIISGFPRISFLCICYFIQCRFSGARAGTARSRIKSLSGAGEEDEIASKCINYYFTSGAGAGAGDALK
jgi:hypothetical protein